MRCGPIALMKRSRASAAGPGQMIDLAVAPRGALHPRTRARRSRRSASAPPECPRRCRRRLSLRHFASTAASSIAIPAPCAANGSIACAASPSSAIAPLAPFAAIGHREQRPAPPFVDGADHHPRGRRPAREANAFLISLARRARSSPACSRFPAHRDDVDLARRPRSDRRPDARSVPSRAARGRGIFARQLRGVERAAPGDQAGELRLHLRETMMPHRGPDAVGADQRHRQFLLPRHAAALDHGQPLGVGGDVLELAAEPQLDVGIVVDLGLQRRLQIGAMHHPIGRAGAKGGGLAERQAGDLAAAARAHDADGLGRHGARRKPRLQAEFDQDAAGVGRKLQAGAGFLEPLGLLQNDDAKALSRRAPAPPSVLRSRHQRRRWCATRPRVGQATLSFSTHSGGRASPAARSAAKRYSVEQ
jgi:hypothetical protein